MLIITITQSFWNGYRRYRAYVLRWSSFGVRQNRKIYNGRPFRAIIFSCRSWNSHSLSNAKAYFFPSNCSSLCSSICLATCPMIFRASFWYLLIISAGKTFAENSSMVSSLSPAAILCIISGDGYFLWFSIMAI